jgi:putative mycofactocin binding protein MftB
VASTDDAGFDLPRPTTYLVPDWVRVRRESFGLLFYNTRSTKLTFVRSGDALTPPPFAGPDRLLHVGPLPGSRRAAVGRLLENLVDRGLIVATQAE